jgi:hypothetical protein
VNKLCPGCNTAYNIAAPDVGREFSCFKCNAALIVRKDGIRLANAPPAPVAVDAGIPAAEPDASGTPYAGPNSWQRLTVWFGVVATWLFGIGAFLVIVFLFFPLINQTKLARAKAAIQAGQLRDDRMERELKQKLQDKKDVGIAEEEVRKRAHEAWVKQKERQQADLDELEQDVRQSDYGYTWGMMFGFLFLAAAALGYLTPAQPPIRRVVGAIVLVAEVLLIFLKYVISVGR